MLRLIKKETYEEFDLLENSVDIPITIQATSATNPTKYVTEYSKIVKLPLTPHNMELLNYYPETDSVIFNYNPLLSTDVFVLNDDDIVFEGKMKLEKVNDYANNRNMECTLYGLMNEFFNKMLNTTYWYDSIDADGNKINSLGKTVLPNILDNGYNICKETVINSWYTLPPSYGYAINPIHLATLELQDPANMYDPVNSKSHSIIAWAPAEQGELTNFNSDKVIVGGYYKNSSDKYIMQLCAGSGILVSLTGKDTELRYLTTNEENKGIAEVIEEQGLSERQWLQYRSYYQKPTVFVNKIFQHYKKLSKDITGLDLELDSEWFNSNNTRYTDLVYTLPDLQQNQKETTTSGGADVNLSWSNVSLDCHQYAFGSSGGKYSTIGISGTGISNNRITVSAGTTAYCNFNINLSMYLRRAGSLSSSSEFALCNGDGSASAIDAQIIFRNVNDTNETSAYKFRFIDEDNTSWSTSTVDETIRLGTYKWNPDPRTLTFNLQGEVLVGNNVSSSDKEYEMIAYVYCTNGNIDGGPGQALFQSRGRIRNINALCESCGDNPVFTFSNVSTKITSSSTFRSFYGLEMKNLFPANYSPFNILLQYTKLFNLVWDYDRLANKVTVMTKEKWYRLKQNEILDWTDLLDKGKEYSFKPLNWDKRYISFNYEDFEMDWLKEYKKKYGHTYGSKVISTQYRFNNDTENLMGTNDSDKINPSIQVSMERFPLRMIVETSATPLLYKETFIGNRKDGKQANIWGQFFFRNGNTNWDADSYKKQIYIDATPDGNYGSLTPQWTQTSIAIVDDTDFQIRRNIFAPDLTIYFSNKNRRLFVADSGSRPVFSVYDKDGIYSCQFSKPSMNYYTNEAPEMNITRLIPIVLPTGTTYYLQLLVPAETNAVDTYTDRWESIITEQYNEQNKLITCYVWLNDTDINKLKCNRFVIIGNVLYTIFKVHDYQIGKGGRTKVDLLQVYDMQKYTKAPIITGD